MKRIITTGILMTMLLTGCSAANNRTEVTVAVAKSEKDLSSVIWQGIVEPLSRINVMPNGSGKVIEIPVKEGDRVGAGDVLFTIDNENARLQLEQAKANYHVAEVAFTNAEKASNENTSVAPAEIAYTTARNNFNRIQVLYANGDIAQADYEAAKAQMDSAQAQLKGARNGQSGSYDAAMAQLDGARAALDLMQKQYDDCVVTSPIEGIVTDVHIAAGQMVSPQLTAVTVIDDSSKKVEIKVADLDILQLSVGTLMNVNLPTFYENCQGTITEISAVSDNTTGMFTVKIDLDESSKVGYIGLQANVQLADSEKGTSVYVPAKCVKEEGDEIFVYTVEEGAAKKIRIAAGKRKNAYLEVVEGLTEGDVVVMQSSSALADGAPVHVLSVK